MVTDPLLDAFAARLPPGVDGGGAGPALRALFVAGRAAWPGIDVTEDAFGGFLAGHAQPAAPLPLPAFAADVYLAAACALGVKGGAAAFERAFGDGISRAAARVDGAPAFVADARQTVLEHLLVARPDALPRIAEYGGRAPLRAWLRAVTLRTTLNLRRRKADQTHDEVDDDGPDPGAAPDPEVAYLKARYKAELEAAVRAAVQRLSSRERAILRENLVEGQSIDALAARYGVGRSTAARWLAAARDALREHTQAALTAKLGASQVESVARLVRSQLDMSATSLLREEPAA